jgi:hypothetical protein
MINQQHPIIPPEDLLQQLRHSADTWLGQITIAYQAGADLELEACCEWLAYEGHEHEHLALYAARRPKPPSLKEQALEALQFVEKLDLPRLHNHCNAIHTIRRALEALPND